MPKKRFSGIFPAFSAGKISVTFSTLSFCVNVQNFMKKYQVQLEIFKKYCFSGENWLFRRFFDSSGGFKNKFFLIIETCEVFGITINNVFVWKNNEIRRKNPNKICKKAISGIFPVFSAEKKFFLKNRTRPCFEHC